MSARVQLVERGSEPAGLSCAHVEGHAFDALHREVPALAVAMEIVEAHEPAIRQPREPAEIHA